MMSLVLVFLVSGLVFLYVRASRNRRLEWLKRLQLVGAWTSEEDVRLILSGNMERGDFELVQGADKSVGTWQLVGHALHLKEAQTENIYDVRLFRAGNIGLTDSTGVGRVYEKENDNVVAFDRGD
jgi:hypothetical protein